MKKSLLTFFLLCTGKLLWGQNVNFDQVLPFGAGGADECNSVATDASGNRYATGYFTGRVDFDPGKDTFYMASNGGKDAYLVKFDDKGTFKWAVQIGGTHEDKGNALSVDTFGFVYLTGSFQSKVDFDPDTSSRLLTSAGRSDLFVCKFNSSGKLIKVNKAGGKSEDEGKGLAAGKNGNVYITGIFSDSLMVALIGSSKTILTSFGSTDVIILMLDTGFNFVWAKQVGGSTADYGYAIALDNSESPHITGSFTGKGDFDPGSGTFTLTSAGDADVFVLKLNAKGTLVWVRPYSGRAYEQGSGIDVDPSGNVHVTGLFNGTVDFDPGKGLANLNSAGKSDIFIAKLNANGDYVWALRMGGTEDDAGNGIQVDASSNIYTTGYFADRVDFDPGTSTVYLSAAGGSDVFIHKLGSSGNYLWAKHIGGRQTDIGRDISTDASKTIYVAGSFSDKADFNPAKDTLYRTSNGDLDAFVHIMKVCSPSKSTLNASSCYSYSFLGTSYTQSGTYQVVTTNVGGCDSTITLNLTIHTTTFNYMQVVACKSYTLNGVTYQTAGTYNQLLVNANGCDSIIVLELTFGESSSSINQIVCNSYTLNGITYTKSGTYTQTIKNRFNCDSTITVKLTVKKSTSATLNITACKSYSILGKSFTSSGIYPLLTKNAQDCDSNITLNLLIHAPSETQIAQTVCDSFVLNGIAYHKSGTFTQTLSNRKGCDSLVILKLQVNGTSSVINQNACKKFVLHQKVYTQSGTYNIIIPNSRGCDSNITLNLTVFKVNNQATSNGAILTAAQSDAKYQWLDCDKQYLPIPGEVHQSMLAKRNGNYAVQVTENECTDTSACLNVNFNSVTRSGPESFRFMPNPMNHTVQYQSAIEHHHARIRISDCTGRKVFESPVFGGRHFEMDVSLLSKGVYVIQVTEDQLVYQTRLVKE